MTIFLTIRSIVFKTFFIVVRKCPTHKSKVTRKGSVAMLVLKWHKVFFLQFTKLCDVTGMCVELLFIMCHFGQFKKYTFLSMLIKTLN